MMMRWKVTACLLFSALSAAAPQEGATGRPAVVPLSRADAPDMSREEALVRTAYAKLAYASEQGVIGQLAIEAGGSPVPKDDSGMTSDQRLAAAQVTFNLGDFVVGNLSDIINRKAIDLVTLPSEEMLSAPLLTSSINEGVNRTMYSVQPRWETASKPEPEALKATVGEALDRLQWGLAPESPTWDRYASYSVVVTFQGKSRGPYQALFIFGHDPRGNAMVMPHDATTDSTALAEVMSLHLFPGPLVESSWRTYPVVSEWLNARRMSGATCSRGQGDVCCDLIRLRCGPGKDDVADGLSKPLPAGAVPWRP